MSYAPSMAIRAGYSHRITYETLTRYVGWQTVSFDTTGDAVNIHLTCLYVRARIGRDVRNVTVALLSQC